MGDTMLSEKWQAIIDKEQQKPYFKELKQFLVKEYNNEIVFPPKEQIMTALELTPFKNVKVVILGQDPYHNYNQAHGLAFSVKKGNKVPPSLKNIYKELKRDLGVTPKDHGNLSSWAKEGVLLLNAILTVRAHSPLSHKNKGWEIFTNTLIKKLDQDDTPKVFVLWGNKAKAKKSLITNPNHLILESSHPSPFSARYSFFGSQVFSKINAFLEANNRSKITFN
ncbi:MAG: uracil-DNA glycosylase [Candidatus Izimaplasma sp.]|nr:uracil-DNA glycosylase [Candidatus Izimaplasma bacterium]